jgi:energy-coupling factor transporter ATP-binding protein EcfA2
MIDSVSEQTGADAGLKKAAQQRRPTTGPDWGGMDRIRTHEVNLLPPHDDAAEEACLGCALNWPADCVTPLMEKFGAEEVFYDLRRQAVWLVVMYLKSKDQGIDAITVQAELQRRNQLEQAGGLAYLVQMQDAAIGPSFMEEYAAIVWEKFVARKLIQKNVQEAGTMMEFGGAPSEAFFAQVDENFLSWKKLLERGAASPRNLCRPADFADGYYNAWFERKEDDYGYELPFGFPLRIRPAECTLFTGDNGSGKSSMLGQIGIVAARQFAPGRKLVIASMEVPPEVTLWIMGRQLLGEGRLERNADNERKVRHALAWLQERVLIYNFQGITDWRELLNTFRYAREHLGGEIFEVDSVMRIGIADDDYATQGLAAAQFADFCVKTGAHTFLVVHENKGGEGRAKDRVRGSKQWTDNANNVCGMIRNEKKAEKLAELEEKLTVCPEAAADTRQEMDKQYKVWDAKFVLSKQRWPGSRQNGARWLYWCKSALQFHEYPGEKPKRYIEPPEPLIRDEDVPAMQALQHGAEQDGGDL